MGEDFPCLIHRLSRQFNTVDDGKRVALASPDNACNRSRRDTETTVLPAPSERDPDLCGAALEHVQEEFGTHLLVWSQFQRAGMNVTGTRGFRYDRPPSYLFISKPRGCFFRFFQLFLRLFIPCNFFNLCALFTFQLFPNLFYIK